MGDIMLGNDFTRDRMTGFHNVFGLIEYEHFGIIRYEFPLSCNEQVVGLIPTIGSIGK